jgi:uncharacterized membrane protein
MVLSGRNRQVLFLVLALYALIYASISLVNHYCFRTYALDLGYMNQALHSLSRFRMPVYTLDITGREMNFFATHFSLVMVLYLPFYYLLGTYTLLVIQLVSVLAGGIGIYRLSLERGNSQGLSLVILVFFFSLWGIFSALSFDFHNSVVAAMMLPWFILFMERKKYRPAVLFFVLMLMCRESIALWMVFILLACMIRDRQEKRPLSRFKLSLTAVAFAWFMLVSMVLMPSLLPEGVDGQFWKYSHIGGSLPEVLSNIFLSPGHFLNILFSNTTGEAIYNGIKPETLLVLFVSGGFVLFIRPLYLLMILPVLLMKFLSGNYAHWGINYHYSIEFAPVLAIALSDLKPGVRSLRLRKFIIIISCFLAIGTTVTTLEKRKSRWYNSENSRFYTKAHFKCRYNLKEVKRGLSLIKMNSRVSASSELAPHLQFSGELYHFPQINNSEYVAVLKTSDVTYPLGIDNYLSEIEKLRTSSAYGVLYESEDLIVFGLTE